MHGANFLASQINNTAILSDADRSVKALQGKAQCIALSSKTNDDIRGDGFYNNAIERIVLT